MAMTLANSENAINDTKNMSEWRLTTPRVICSKCDRKLMDAMADTAKSGSQARSYPLLWTHTVALTHNVLSLRTTHIFRHNGWPIKRRRRD